MGYLKKLLAFLLVLAATSAAAQSVPPLISYQGRLMDSGGLPITGASVPMTFALWDGETAGTMLWSESQAVEVSGGLYGVLLGDSVPVPASVFSGSTVYLEVTVMGETLAPRERMTAVPYADRADDSDNLGGLAASAYSLVGHTHDFSDVTGTATDAQIPDNITINLAVNAAQLGGQPASAYVLVAGDTVTGDLQVNGRLTGLGNLKVGNDLYAMSGRIGLGAVPSAGYGILNSAGSPPSYGAYLFGSLAGVRGVSSTSPSTFGSLGQDGVGVSGNAGTAASATNQYGGNFISNSANIAYGVSGLAYGYGANPAVGVSGYAVDAANGMVTGGQFSTDSGGTGLHVGVMASAYGSSSSPVYGTYSFTNNSSTGPVYAGYFATSASGSGTHYGVFAEADDYAGWFQTGKVHVGSGGAETYMSGNGDLYVQNRLEVDNTSFLQGDPWAVMATWSGDPLNNYGYLATANSGAGGYVGTSSATGTKYGGYFQGTANDYVYGTYGVAYGYSSTRDARGAYGFAANYNSGPAFGGYFTGGSPGTGEHTGVFGNSGSTGAANSIGVEGFGNNTGSGNAYGGRFTATTSGAGIHYGAYATADDYPVYAQHSTDPNVKAWLGRIGEAVYGQNGNSSSTGTRYGGDFSATSTGTVYGLLSNAAGYGTSSTFGLYSYAYAGASGGTAYGAYLYALAPAGTQYGLLVANGTKNWVNPDPEDPTKSIVYATLEGGENGTYWRGTAQLTNGYAVVEMPDHFRKVTSPDYPVTVTVSPLAECNGLYIVSKSNERIEVKELNHGTSAAAFDFIIMGKRLGYEEHEPIIDNVDYVPFQGNLSGMDDSKVTTQEFYDHQSPGLKSIFEQNGTLDKNGKVNEAAFKARGWKEVRERAPGKN